MTGAAVDTEAVKGHVEALFRLLPGGLERNRVQQCLGRDDLDEMRTLLREFESHTGEKTLEERLAALLETHHRAT